MAIVIAGTIGHGDCYCWDHRPWRLFVIAGTIGHGNCYCWDHRPWRLLLLGP